MKHRILKLILAALVINMAVLPINAENNLLTPGLQIIAKDFSMVKTGISGASIYFSDEDFENALNVEKVNKITVCSLPDPKLGHLRLGNIDVMVGQTISSRNLKNLHFVPNGITELQTNFSFCNGGTPYGTKYNCNLYSLNRINSSPVITQMPTIESGAFSGMQYLGTIKADDPDGDSFKLEIMSRPKGGSVYFSDDEQGYYVYTPNPDFQGKDSFTLRAVDEYGGYSNTVKVSINVEKADETEVFSDLKNHWASSAVVRCQRAGIIESGELFYPDEEMSRAEFLDFMMKTAGYTGFSTENTGFADDSAIPDEYKGSVALAEVLGIVSGIETDKGLCFYPNNKITRAEAAVIITGLVGSDDQSAVSVSTDDSIPVWAKASMSVLKDRGIIRGKEVDGKVSLAPFEVVTRAAAAQMAVGMINR